MHINEKLFLALALVLCGVQSPGDDFSKQFANPPDTAKPQTWWHWMNGNITKAGITGDLEAMKQIGLSGATIVNVDCGIPPGPVKFMSPEWRDDFKFAVQEADRLGLKLCVENCAGWSSSGGPWNTATNAMQRLTSAETNVQGPVSFDAILPEPPANLGYYRDIGVLAFQVPALQTNRPANVSASPGELQIRRAVYAGIDGGSSADVTTNIVARIQRGEKSVVVNNDELGGDPAYGQFKHLQLEFTLDGKPEELTIDEGGTLIFPTDAGQLAAAQLLEKSSVDRTFVQPQRVSVSGAVRAIPQDGIIDLTDKLSSDGRLRWEAPPGNWTVLRLGYTPIGVNNHPAPKEGEGLECDKLSRSALDTHWNGFMQKVLDDIGPLAGKSLDCSLIDSYEVGNQDWSANFREEFEKRRGYDPLKFLPTFTHRVVNSPEITERFLWDMRRTVADLFADNYYAYFAELCHKHGLQSAIEPYSGPFESLQCGKPADVVMGEFWTGSQGNPSIKLVASLAHIYGKQVVGAESFTASGDAGRWKNDPYSLKTLGDLMFCQGLNCYVFHRYAMQPWTNRWPGMTMGEYGLQIERTLTWWKQGKSWIDYITRCQYLLQQGRAVADVAYFTGEGAPMEMGSQDPPMPVGYEYDAVNADVLLHGATVKDGRVILASGASYAALVLPTGDTSMTPGMLGCISELVRSGATVVGPRPYHSPSLADYPHCDAKVGRLADALWGSCDGQKDFENHFGNGRVVWGKSLETIFKDQDLRPDFEVTDSDEGLDLKYAHRVAGDTEIYFISNQRERFGSAKCTFRVNGKTPELWHPDTGVMEPAPVWNAKDGRLQMRLNFDPAGSVFVVFRPSAAVNHLIYAQADMAPEVSIPLNLKIQRAVYAAADGAGEMDVTARLAELAGGDQLTLPVKNAVLGGDPATNHVKQLRVDYLVDGQPGQITVRENDTLVLPHVTALGPAPSWEVSVARDGSPQIKLWGNGKLKLNAANETYYSAEITNVPPPHKISGPWNVSFPPGWGAPPLVAFSDLISWTDHTNDGVRYFSGTATYEKDVWIATNSLIAGQELWLNLGRVKNFAEVFLNGHDLGVLWKPPFRVNITPAAKAGKNKLVIKVTNLWPNRLIGDEQLAADCEWDGSRLKEWPHWLLDGKPSPTGRFTFATWHYYSKNSPLLESGLLGPVALETAVINVPIASIVEPYVSPTNGLGSWIWSEKTEDEQTCQFWKTFEIPKGVQIAQAALSVTADDEFTAYLDGRELGRGADWRELYAFDSLGPLLDSGRHVLAIRAYNAFHFAGLIVGMRIDFADGRHMNIKSDESWRIVPETVKNFTRLTTASPDWPFAVVQAPLGAGPWQTFPVNIDRMPALLPIKIYFWQTGWFQISLLSMSVLVILFSLRLMAQLALHRKERWLLQQERARIAREIHDDIGARMTQLVLHGELAQNGVSEGSETGKQLVHLCEEARGLLSTMDEILWAVNPRRDTLRDFTAYVCNYMQKFLMPTSIQPHFEVDAEMEATAFDLPLRRSLLMAIKEALNNAVKYSGATEVCLQIKWDGQWLLVAVQDNGTGFDAGKSTSQRNGVNNMRQRMQELGGSCHITSQPGRGCRVQFSIPLKNRGKSWWTRAWNSLHFVRSMNKTGSSQSNPTQYHDPTKC